MWTSPFLAYRVDACMPRLRTYRSSVSANCQRAPTIRAPEARQALIDYLNAGGPLALDDSGAFDLKARGLVHLALAFVLEHPAVSSAIIGPRTMEHLEGQLGAADIRLEPAVLDRIDELVPPGTTVNPADAGWSPPGHSRSARRRVRR